MYMYYYCLRHNTTLESGVFPCLSGRALEHARCRAKFMTCEIHDYRGCAHALVMRMIAVGSYISQLECNNTWLNFFAHFFVFRVETNSSTDTT